MRSQLVQAAERVRMAPKRLSAFGLMSFEQLLDAVREQGAPIGRQVEVLELVAGKHKELFKAFELPTKGFETIGAMEEEDWLYLKMQLALLHLATEMVAAGN